jgi:hypothetical protein
MHQAIDFPRVISNSFASSSRVNRIGNFGTEFIRRPFVGRKSQDEISGLSLEQKQALTGRQRNTVSRGS